MMLRNPAEEYYGFAPENVFLVVDEYTGQTVASCIIDCRDCDAMFPVRPVQVKLILDGEIEHMDTLMGAAMGRARMLCMGKNAAARIYADCAPEDEELLGLMKQYGFRDNDAMVRYARTLPSAGSYTAPAGCVVIKDKLDDPVEQKLFLDRWNSVYGVKNDMDWLAGFADHENFQRILMVAPAGIVGEVITWSEGNTGVIAFVQTSYRWRNMGVARFLMMTACNELSSLGLKRVVTDLREVTPHMPKMLDEMGFKQTRVLRCYPGIDVGE